MALTITLTRELEQKLDVLAAENGQNTTDYALSLLEKQTINGHHANGSMSHSAAQNGTRPDMGTRNGADEDPDAPARAIAEIPIRTSEQIAEARARLLAVSRPARPLPPGKTFANVLAGEWPLHQTNETEDLNVPVTEMAAWDTRTPEEKARQIKELLALSRPARPLPPGKTILDVIVGQWPGDETDEEVQAALDDLS